MDSTNSFQRTTKFGHRKWGLFKRHKAHKQTSCWPPTDLPGVFGENGQLNQSSIHLEEYAISCLSLGGQERPEVALGCFDARANARRERRRNILYLYPTLKSGVHPSPEFSPVSEKLGYEGVLAYAKLCADFGREGDATVLLTQIIAVPVLYHVIPFADAVAKARALLRDINDGKYKKFILSRWL